MREYNIALLGVSTQNMNKGCEALLYAELHLLKGLENPDRHFNFFLLEGSSREKTVYYDLLGEKVKVTVLPIIADTFPYSLLLNAKNRKEIKRYKTFDYVLAIGFGDSFADIYGMERFHSINNPIKQCIKRGRKLVIMPQTIGPFKDEVLLSEAINTINQSIVVFPRDRQSYEFVVKYANNNNVREIIDVAFFLPYKKNKFDNGKINVGFAVSGLLWRNGYTGKNEFGLQSDYKKLTLELIEWLAAQDNVRVILTPHVVSGNALCEDDYTLSYHIQQELGEKKVGLSPFFKDPIMAKSFISGLDFFVGSRMHACIAAFSSGVPVVPISYSRKFTGLFEDTLDYHFVADPTSSSQEEVMEIVRSCFMQRDSLKQIVKDAINGIVKERGMLFKDEFEKLLKK